MEEGGGVLLIDLFIFENVSLVELMYRVFTRMPAAVTVGNSGLCSLIAVLI